MGLFGQQLTKQQPATNMRKTFTLCLIAFAAAERSKLRSVAPEGASTAITPAEQFADATTMWVRAVTKKNDPRLVTNQFCSDGILWGTVSQSIRGGKNGDGNEVGGAVERYFDFFAKIPGIMVKKAEDNVARVTDDVYVNNANVKWMHDGLDAPLNARMTFIYRRDQDHANGWCIFQLHSSAMPELNTDLKAISGDEGHQQNMYSRRLVPIQHVWSL